jgi:hypothetical protein
VYLLATSRGLVAMTYRAPGGAAVALSWGLLAMLAAASSPVVAPNGAPTGVRVVTETNRPAPAGQGSFVFNRNGWGDGTPQSSNAL